MVEALTGSLGQLPLADLLRMLGAGGQTGRLELSSGFDQGDIYLSAGALVHAETGGEWGEPAFQRFVSWHGGQFRFEPGAVAPEATIERPLDELLASAEVAAKEREAIQRVVPSLDVVARMARVAPGPTVTVSADDWGLLAALDGVLPASEVASALSLDGPEAATRLYRLKLAGLIEFAALAQPAPVVARALAGPAFFKVLTPAVAQAVGPLAELIIDDAVEDMGFSRDTLPRDAIPALAERISGEIPDTGKRVRFQQTMLAMIRRPAA